MLGQAHGRALSNLQTRGCRQLDPAGEGQVVRRDADMRPLPRTRPHVHRWLEFQWLTSEPGAAGNFISLVMDTHEQTKTPCRGCWSTRSSVSLTHYAAGNFILLVKDTFYDGRGFALPAPCTPCPL